MNLHAEIKNPSPRNHLQIDKEIAPSASVGHRHVPHAFLCHQDGFHLLCLLLSREEDGPDQNNCQHLNVPNVVKGREPTEALVHAACCVRPGDVVQVEERVDPVNLVGNIFAT